MDVLKKYKKLGEQGFKDFVLSLDLRSSKLLKEVLENAMIEDPLYLKWALENRQPFESFLGLGKEEVHLVLKMIPNSELHLLHALKNHKEEENFITTKLPNFNYKQYLANRDVHQVTMQLQENARIKILEQVFALKQEGILPAIEWSLPPHEVMEGVNPKVDAEGNFRQFYDNGALAISGKIEKGKRVGRWMIFYSTGKLFAEGDYALGLKTNEWVFHFPSGKCKSQGCYVEDLKHGEWKIYDESGAFQTQHWQNGRLVSS